MLSPVVLLFLALVAPAADAHSSMIMPPPRNAIDSLLPPWSGGKHPPTGTLDAKKAPCTNGTSVCDSGQSVFWCVCLLPAELA